MSILRFCNSSFEVIAVHVLEHDDFDSAFDYAKQIHFWYNEVEYCDYKIGELHGWFAL